MNGSVEELREALRDSLGQSGKLGELKASLRAGIFNCLAESDIAPRPALSNENLLINELIREYLQFNGYRETLSVFLPETGQPPRPFERSIMKEHLSIVEGPRSRQLPLLYALTSRSPDQGPPPQHS